MKNKLTYEQEVHALLCAAAANTESLIQFFEAQEARETGEFKKLTRKCIEWKRDDLRRIRDLIPQALERRDSVAGTASAPQRFGIYIASKTKHAAKWKGLRASGEPIISTWIDEAGIGETKSFEDLWRRCIDEAAHAERLVVYAEEGDELKGALVEVGAALASGTPVWIVGKVEALKTARNHRLMRQAASLKEAFSGVNTHLAAAPSVAGTALEADSFKNSRQVRYEEK